MRFWGAEMLSYAFAARVLPRTPLDDFTVLLHITIITFIIVAITNGKVSFCLWKRLENTKIFVSFLRRPWLSTDLLRIFDREDMDVHSSSFNFANKFPTNRMLQPQILPFGKTVSRRGEISRVESGALPQHYRMPCFVCLSVCSSVCLCVCIFLTTA